MKIPTPEVIKRAAKHTGLSSNMKVSEMRSGEGHRNFLLEEGGQRYVVRVKRDDVPVSTELLNEHHMLKFIESSCIDFAPKSIFYDTDTDTHVISYMAGDDVSFTDLSQDEEVILMQQMVAIEHLQYDTYERFCADNDISHTSEGISATEHFHDVGVNKFEKFREQATGEDNDMLQEWISERLDQVGDSLSQKRRGLKFFHGDLRYHPKGGNIRRDEKLLNFIDWEFSGFKDSFFSELADMVVSIPHTRDNVARIGRLLHLYSTMTGRSLSETSYHTLNACRFVAVMDVIWAAHRYTTMRQREQTGWENYRIIALQRMHERDQFFQPEFLLLA